MRENPVTFTVNTLADTIDANAGDGIAADANGKTSLRAAIGESNARGKGDVGIEFDPTIADGNGKIVVNLSKSIESTVAVVVNGDIGTQHFVTVTSGSGYSQFLWSADGGEFYAMHFTGAVTESDGGAIHVTSGKSLGIYNCSFMDNKADEGGAIRNEGTLTIGESSFHANRANTGGAISSSGDSLSIWYTSLSGNTADSTGAVETSDNTVLFSNCYFYNNSTPSSAGAIYFNALDSASVENCTFEKNTSAHDGGAIYVRSSIATICESTFMNNTSFEGNGGAIFMIGSEAIIIYSTFSANTAIYSGTDPMKGNGGAMLVDDSDVTIQDSYFCKNSATRAGHCVAYVDGKNYKLSYENNQGLEGTNWLGEAE